MYRVVCLAAGNVGPLLICYILLSLESVDGSQVILRHRYVLLLNVLYLNMSGYECLQVSTKYFPSSN